MTDNPQAETVLVEGPQTVSHNANQAAAGHSPRATEAELYVLLRKAGEDRYDAQALIDRHRDEVLRRQQPADRAAIIAELLPAWEAVYEPGNVSDCLIGYANSEAPAKAAAEAWMRSQAEVTGRLEWVPDEQLATGRYDQWFELIERHDDGIDTGPGLIVRRRMADRAGERR